MRVHGPRKRAGMSSILPSMPMPERGVGDRFPVRLRRRPQSGQNRVDDRRTPLTVSSIASRSFVSVRSLQQGFRRHLGTSPMAYLRAVRLRRAHQTLLESDPSTVSVAAVAYRWGFSNLGRFARCSHGTL